jgi:hypothetical protein
MGQLMQAWQKDVVKEIFDAKTRVVSMPRHTGKTTFSQVVEQWNSMLENQRQPVRTIDRELVDGDTWYLVEVQREVAEWIRTQDPKSWYQHQTFTYSFDVSGRLYTMLNLKW